MRLNPNLVPGSCRVLPMTVWVHSSLRHPQNHVLLGQFPVSTHDHGSCSQANGAKEQGCSNIKNTPHTHTHTQTDKVLHENFPFTYLNIIYYFYHFYTFYTSVGKSASAIHLPIMDIINCLMSTCLCWARQSALTLHAPIASRWTHLAPEDSLFDEIGRTSHIATFPAEIPVSPRWPFILFFSFLPLATFCSRYFMPTFLFCSLQLMLHQLQPLVPSQGCWNAPHRALCQQWH